MSLGENLKTDAAERFVRKPFRVRMGWSKKQPTEIRRLELRRVRRVRVAEVRRLALPVVNNFSACELLFASHSEATKCEIEPIEDFDDDWFADNQNEWLWDCTMLGLDSIADSERSGFRATIGDANPFSVISKYQTIGEAAR